MTNLLNKPFLISILINVFSNICFAQFLDNFSDSDFSIDPIWLGDVSNFSINNGELQLTAPPVADISYLYTKNDAINNAQWEFLLRFEFNPSSNNFAKVYLVSDEPDLKGDLKGYFLKIGGSSDEISLFKQIGNQETMIINGTDDRINFSSISVRVKVLRDLMGNWELYSDPQGGSNFFLEGKAFDSSVIKSSNFGIVCR